MADLRYFCLMTKQAALTFPALALTQINEFGVVQGGDCDTRYKIAIDGDVCLCRQVYPVAKMPVVPRLRISASGTHLRPPMMTCEGPLRGKRGRVTDIAKEAEIVKGSRTPAARALPHTRAAGVREASGEETAGRVRSVVVRVMGIVMLAVAARRGGPGELELSEAAADGDRVSRRAAWRRHAYRNERHDCGARWR